MEIDKNNVIIKPIVTEKSDALEDQNNMYVFQVNPNANKIQIKDAIKKIFEVRVLSVNTINVKGKQKRIRGNVGFASDWKKAIVKIHSDDRIEAPALG